MRSDDSRPTGLTDEERRMFAEMTQSLDVDSTRGRWRGLPATWVWSLAGLVGLVVAVVTLGVAPVLIPFTGFVLAVVAVSEVARRVDVVRSCRRLGDRLGAAARSDSASNG